MAGGHTEQRTALQWISALGRRLQLGPPAFQRRQRFRRNRRARPRLDNAHSSRVRAHPVPGKRKHVVFPLYYRFNLLHKANSAGKDVGGCNLQDYVPLNDKC